MRVLIGNLSVYLRNPEAIVVDACARKIWGTPLSQRRMGSREYVFAELLFLRLGRVVEYDDIIEAIWGDQEDGGPEDCRRVIHVMACHLRTKLGSSSIHIDTVWGRGLRIEATALEWREAA